jgi:DNA-binding MarR family transcriptional regulator
MRLEEEIQQKSFRNEYHKLAVNILYTHGWLVARFAASLRPFGITYQQYNLLRILRGQRPGPASIATLRERMLDKMSDASRLVERLRAKGFVDRHSSGADRRKAGIVITAEGLQLLDRFEKSNEELMLVFDRISEEDAHLVNEALDTLRDSR